MLMTSWPRPHLEVPQNSKWLLWKGNKNLIKWSVILMATYKTGDLLRSIKFVCVSEGKAFKNYLLGSTRSPPPPAPCNIILPNICELWLKSAVLFLTENKSEAEERGKKKQWCQFVCPSSDYWMQNFFFLSPFGGGFGGNVSPFRVRYLISILRPIIRPNFRAKLHKGETFKSWGKILI